MDSIPLTLTVCRYWQIRRWWRIHQRKITSDWIACKCVLPSNFIIIVIPVRFLFLSRSLPFTNKQPHNPVCFCSSCEHTNHTLWSQHCLTFTERKTSLGGMAEQRFIADFVSYSSILDITFFCKFRSLILRCVFFLLTFKVILSFYSSQTQLALDLQFPKSHIKYSS